MRIGKREYGISYSSDGWEKASQNGKISYSLANIIIGDARTDEEILQSLVHEILHAICYEYGLFAMNRIGNEEQLDTLARGIATTVLLNKFMEGKNVR